MKLPIEYVAGLLDGDGCIDIHRTKLRSQSGYPQRWSPLFTVFVRFSSQNLLVLQRIQETVGGSIHTEKTTYTLVLTCKKAEDLLRLVFPFLVIKAPQAELALALRDHIRTHRTKAPQKTPIHLIEHREALHHQIKQMNGKDSQEFWLARGEKNKAKNHGFRSQYSRVRKSTDGEARPAPQPATVM